MTKSPKSVPDLADELYRQRTDLPAIQRSINLLEQTADGEDDEVYWRLARAHFFLGQQAPSAVQASAYFSKGAVAGEIATRSNPNSVAPQFWYGVNLALLAQNEMLWSAMRHIRRAQHALRRAKEIDASFHGAGSVRVLGRIQHKVPRILGGSKRRAQESYEEAIRIAPENTVTRMYFAELLHEVGKEEAACEQLRYVLSVEMDENWSFEINRDQARASQILEEAARR